MIKYRVMKVLYYVLWAICLIQLCAYLFGPFAGPLLIIERIGSGLYAGGDQRYIAVLSNNLNMEIGFVNFLNKFIAVIYFSSIILGTVSILIFRNDLFIRYKIGLICGGISVMILIGGIWLNQYH